jgi:hypothetical protein
MSARLRHLNATVSKAHGHKTLFVAKCGGSLSLRDIDRAWAVLRASTARFGVVGDLPDLEVEPEPTVGLQTDSKKAAS